MESHQKQGSFSTSYYTHGSSVVNYYFFFLFVSRSEHQSKFCELINRVLGVLCGLKIKALLGYTMIVVHLGLSLVKRFVCCDYPCHVMPKMKLLRHS